MVAPVAKVQKPELPPEPKPWENLNNPVDVMRNCYAATQQVVQILTPGWNLEGITCNATNLVTSWRREIGRLTFIEQALDVSGVDFSSRVLSRDGNTMMATLTLPKPRTSNSEPEYTEDELLNIINDINQALDIRIGISPKNWVSPRGLKYRMMNFNITSNNDPLTWIDLLMKFSGLTVNTVTYDINSANWTYKGVIYEK